MRRKQSGTSRAWGAYWSTWKAVLTLLLVLLLFALPVLSEQRDIRAQPLSRKTKKADWTGVLQVWVLEGWEGSRGVAWLKRRCTAFEAETGVFIRFTEVRNLEDIGNNPPDVLAFAGGAASRETAQSWAEIALPNTIEKTFLPGMLNMGKLENSIRAVPWMLGGYVFLANETICAQKGIVLPEDEDETWGITEWETAMAAARKGVPTRKKAYTPLAMIQPADRTPARVLPEGWSGALPNGAVAGRDAFHSGDVPFLLGNMRDITLLEQAAFPWRLIKIAGTNYCDETNFLAMPRKEEGKNDPRSEMALALVTYLVGSEVQQLVINAGGLSPIEGVELDDVVFEKLREGLRQGMTVRGAFGNEVLLPETSQDGEGLLE